MKKHRGLFLGLALMALMGLNASPAQAELISITVSITGGPSLTTDALATVTATSYNVNSPAGIAALNSFLSTNGSIYQFNGLSGSSNWSGNAVQGQLVLTGEVVTGMTPGTNTGLTITETESGFLAPSGNLPGILRSSSSANFTNQPAGGGQTARSLFNASPTPLYAVNSMGEPVNPGFNGGPVSTAVGPPIPTPYTLTNVLVLGLTKGTAANPIANSFGVTATITAVPEPSALVTMMTGLLLPVGMVGLLRRRRASA